MEQKRWWIGLMLLCVLLGAGCAQTPPAQQSSPTDSAALQALPHDAASLAAAFVLAPDWDHLGLGYYCDATETVRSGYVPYTDAVQVESNLLVGAAHGVCVRLCAAEARDASEALSLLRDRLLTQKQADADVLSVSLGQEDTVRGGKAGIVRAAYGIDEPDGTVRTCYVVLYAVQSEDASTYLMAQFEFDPTAYDETSPALVQELGNAYGLNLPMFS